MKILIYKNDKQNENIALINDLEKILKINNLQFESISNEDLEKNIKADIVYVFGGDGTILRLIDFAIRNDIAILGVNTGNLGFLTEFEKDKYLDSVKMIVDSNFNIDSRSVLKVKFKNICKYALNDAVLQRRYLENYNNLVINVAVSIDETFVDNIKGDGVIVSTPTGSTAYSLSAGGSILAPNIGANSLTPISAHSLKSRPIVYSSNDNCKLEVLDGSSSLFIDGKFVNSLSVGDVINISKSDSKIRFIRKKDSNFYKRLFSKLVQGN